MQSENELANQLRKQCYPNGVEIEPKESAKTLHQLGLVYKEKSPDKISLIQSVALMTSAVLRQPENVDNIIKDLDDVCLHILTLANASRINTTLVDNAVAEAKNKITLLRETTKIQLQKLKPISDDITENKLKKQKQERVVDVRKIQDYVSKSYTDIMHLIASQTVSMMGEPPCKFALLGMGSLAKKEVTPYSDFESIIVLEEGIQTNSNYLNILVYFQWFATIFQMILVRLGETILRFLAISCLNNPLNKKENWFRDANTPCGICPDGFAPQASKNPLGRQTKTQKKPWITELIKPVSEMVKYLETEEDLKNGYHVADMLTKTCFVYGDSGVFEDFEKKVEKKLKEMPIFNQRIQQNIQEDYKQFNMYRFDLNLQVDIKRLALRGCSLFIAPLGHLYKCENFNCFHILDELLDRGIINKTLCDKLKFSYAVGCEMRLRWYIKTSGQNDILHQQQFVAAPTCVEQIVVDIGTRAVIDGLNITKSLQDHVVDCFHDKQIKPIDFVESPVPTVYLAITLKLHEFADKLINECMDLDVCKNEHDQFILHIALAINLFLLERYEESISVGDAILKRWKGHDIVDIKCGIDITCAESLLRLGKCEQALDLFKKLKDFKGIVSPPYNIELNAEIGICYFELNEPKKALEYLDLAYNELKKDVANEYNQLIYSTVMTGYCGCLQNLDYVDKSLKISEELIHERRRLHVDEETDSVLNNAFNDMGISLCKLKRYEEALPYFAKMKKVKFIKMYPRAHSYGLACEVECLTRLGRSSEAESVINDCWHEMKRESKMQLRLTKYEFRCYTYIKIASYRGGRGQYEEAMLFAKKAYHLSRHMVSHKAMRTEIAWILVGSLFSLQRYTECLSAAKHGIKLCQFVYEDCWLKPEFVHIVQMFVSCQRKLGIRETLPYDCTPSIFFHAMKDL